jgi:hypothetical protein
MYEDLQKLVYLDLIKNNTSNIYPAKSIDLYTFSKLSEKILEYSLGNDTDIATLKAVNVTYRDLRDLSKAIDSDIPEASAELDIDL